MIERHAQARVEKALLEVSAVLVIGAPRVGRSSLLQCVLEAAGAEAIYFDCAREEDRNSLAELGDQAFENAYLIIAENIDERSLETIDALVRDNEKKGRSRFVLAPRRQSFVRELQSALTGLLRPIELNPIQPDEAIDASTVPLTEVTLEVEAVPEEAAADGWDQDRHWLRGGYPDSLLAADDAASYAWRRTYIEAIIAGEYPNWGLEPEDNLAGIFSAIASRHGKPAGSDAFAEQVGIKKGQFVRGVTALAGLGLVRRLENRCEDPSAHDNYLVRDSGLLLAQLGITDLAKLRSKDDLHGHSWEGFATEALISCVGETAACFYRDQAGDVEVDLVLDVAGAGRRFAIELKVGENREVENGFWKAAELVEATDCLMVHSGRNSDLSCRPPKHSLISAVEHLRSFL